MYNKQNRPTAETIEQWLSACEDHIEAGGGKLNEWESNVFLLSIRGQFDDRGVLTDPQIETLEKIYCKV